MRLFLFIVTCIIFTGIWLTGFTTAHCLLYLPAIFFILAAATGICPRHDLIQEIV